ncbi:hypothetical protein [Pseudoalteromonas ruthenica]|uniref:hypothetical protein n=1 Tax=Pseudoalteromonas ruthenica TaxID=151081 RepID=UPI00110A6338|nr:hypothetical protein [Pseudoalteromonas ruthenica]TMO46438.1 hypothetical protein CWC24_10070 [Pseudoalteromonas ruthenica]TMO50391.1 hypothetical protein CWC23_11715 [Pseudoalteromonas ruthenica]
MEAKELPKLKAAFESLITSLERAGLPFGLCGEFCYSEYIEPRMSSVFEFLVCASEESLNNTLPALSYDENLGCYTHSSHYDSQWPYTFRIFICDADSELLPERTKRVTAFGLSDLPLLSIDYWVMHEKLRLSNALIGSEHAKVQAYFAAIFAATREARLAISDTSKETIMDELDLSYEDNSIKEFNSGLSWAEVQASKLKRYKEEQGDK